MAISVNNNSVLFSLIGTMFLVIGFIGFMAHTFAKSTLELEGMRLVKLSNLNNELDAHGKVCVVASIHSDDPIEMPDNGQKVIKGRLRIIASWPDGSKSVLLDWNKKSNYISISDSASNYTMAISPRDIECIDDSPEASRRLVVENTNNTTSIQYYQYRFSLNGSFTRGQPRITIQREYISNNSQAAITICKKDGRGSIAPSSQAMGVYPYEKAMQRERGMSKSKTIYIMIGLIGALMFLIPERKAINTISMVKDILKNSGNNK